MILPLMTKRCVIAGYDYLIRWTCFYPRTLNVEGGYNRPEWTQDVRARQKDYFELVKQAEETNINKTWDSYCDLRNSLTLGGAEGTIRDLAYFADSVHLVCDGYKELADYIYDTSFLQLFEEA